MTDDPADGAVVVEGGRSRLRAPTEAIDLGNSGTGMRLLTGVVAGVPGVTRLTGDASLRSRPMDRVADPLGRMGARVDGVGERCLPPLSVTGTRLHGIDYTPPMASAQVKGALLLAGLDADGDTVVREPVATRAHTEEMLAEAGADVDVEPWGSGRVVRVRRSALRPVDRAVPGDPSQAAFWAVAGVVVPGSAVTVDRVHLGPERIGFVGVLVRMGAALVVHDEGGGTGSLTAATRCSPEPRWRRPRSRRWTRCPSWPSPPWRPTADPVPGRGRTAGQGVGPSGRDGGPGAGVRRRRPGGGRRSGGRGWRRAAPGNGDAHGDHRMAMAAAVAGAACPGGHHRGDRMGVGGHQLPGLRRDPRHWLPVQKPV